MYMNSFNLLLQYGGKGERRVPSVESLNNRTEVGQDKEEQFRSNIMKPKKLNKTQVNTTAFYK